MKIEDQVCTLKQAKRLRELGVKQATEFYYRGNNVWHFNEVTDWPNQEQLKELIESGVEGDNIVSAFTVAELGEMLPSYINPLKEEYPYRLNIWNNPEGQDGLRKEWRICYKSTFGNKRLPTNEGFIAYSEAESRAEMLIYLLENKLVTLD